MSKHKKLPPSRKSSSNLPPGSSKFLRKLNTETDVQELRLQGETFMSDSNRVRNELRKAAALNVPKNVYNGLEEDIRLVPPSFSVQKPLPRKSKPAEEFDKVYREELRNIFKNKPKQDTTYAGLLQRRIQGQRQDWKSFQNLATSNSKTDLRSRSLDLGAVSRESRYRNLKQAEETAYKDTKEVVNDKLAEISRQFRESLKLSSEPKNFIKVPKHSSVDLDEITKKNKAFRKAKATVESLKSDWDNFVDSRETVVTFTDETGENENVEKVEKKDNVIISKPLKTRKSSLKSSSTSKRPDQTDSNLDFAGIVKFRSLLEANSSELFANKVKKGGLESLDDHRRNVDPQYPHQSMGKMIGPPKNLDLYQAARQIIKGKKDRELRFEMDSSGRGSVAPQSKGMPQKVMKGSSDAQTWPSGQEAYSKISPEHIQQKLGHSVKSMEDAAKLANALGSLMTRVAASRMEGGDSQPKMPGTAYNFPSNRVQSGMSTMTMTEDLSVGTENGTGTRVEIQTQTETPSYYSLKPPVPEIIFKKDMSQVDQTKLEELRAKKRDWDAHAAQLWRETSNN